MHVTNIPSESYIFFQKDDKASFLLFLLFQSCHAACGILVSWPGIEPMWKLQSPNHWTAREFPKGSWNLMSELEVHFQSTYQFQTT